MKKKGISIAGIFLALLMPFFVFAYTSPGKATGFVNDFANILSPSDKAEIESTLSNYEKQTGNEITIVTIQSLGDETIETYAVKLFEDWKIGKAKEDNGLLMLFAMDERKMRIEVGYGLEPYITDAWASNIIRNELTPAFKSGDYAGGITKAVDKIIRIISGDVQVNEVSADTPSGSGFPIENFFFILIFVFMGLTSIMSRSKSWWLGGILGGVIGVILGFVYASIITGVVCAIIFGIIGLIFDYIVSKAYAKSKKGGGNPPWWIGGGGFGSGSSSSGGSSFGGFGGGSSGGGGASGGW